MGVHAAEVLVVGDYIYDVEAGRRAGARTVLLTNRGPGYALDQPPDFTIEELEELASLLRRLAPLEAGKLPNELLAPLLDELGATDPALLIAPGVGQDVAAARLAGEEVLVLKADPITFATDAVGRYAVIVNCNDIATAGADPRWLLTTLLFPVGACLDDVARLVRELAEAAREQGLILCGGHTEVTDAVTRPIVAAQVAGTVTAARLIDKRRVARGDRIYLTKRIAVEGTSLIARELGGELARIGLPAGEIARCRDFLVAPGISVVREARIAADCGASALHDVTEGGVATALEELSAACGRRLRIELGRIPIYDETERLCRLLEVDPLGLIASGSLIVVAPPAACEALEVAIAAAGIELHRIGEALDGGVGIEARAEGEASVWPRFEVDELARVLARVGRQRT